MRENVRRAIDEGAMLYLQQLEFEMAGLRLLVSQAARTGKPDTGNFELLVERCQKANAAYQIAFEALAREIAPEYQGEEYSYTVNYLTGEFIVYSKEGRHD